MAVRTPHTLSNGLTVNVFFIFITSFQQIPVKLQFHICSYIFSLFLSLYLFVFFPFTLVFHFIFYNVCMCVCVCCFCSYPRLTLLPVACLCVVDTALPSTTSYLCSRPTTGPPSVSVFPTSTLNSSSLSTTSWSGTVQ